MHDDEVSSPLCSDFNLDSVNPDVINQPEEFINQVKQFGINNTRNLKFGFLNVNSLRYKFNELKFMLLMNCLDIFALGETNIDASFQGFDVDNYILIRYDRNANAGGLCVYVRQDLACTKLTNISDVMNTVEYVECIILDLCIRKKKWIFLIIYKSPKVNDKIFTRKFEICLEKALDISNDIVVMGDINFNMMYENPFSNICNNFDLSNLIAEPTCFKGVPSLLDVFMVNNTRRFKNTLNISCPISDHHNLICSATKCHLPPQVPKLIYYRSMKQFNLEQFLINLEYIPMNVCDVFDNVNDNFWTYTLLLNDVVETHSPLKKKHVKKPSPVYMNSELRKAIHKKHTLRNKYQTGKAHWDAYKRQRNHVTNLRKKSVKIYFAERCNGGSKNQHFWKTVKPLFGSKNSQNTNHITLHEDHGIISDQTEVCEIFNKYFSNIADDIGFSDSFADNLCTENLRKTIEKYDNHPSILNIKNVMRTKLDNVSAEFNFTHVNHNDIYKIIKALDSHKSCGYDHLPAKLLKLGNVVISSQLTPIINKCIYKYVYLPRYA